MMTPDTPEGHLTEKIMAAVRERLPEITTHTYNRTYEAVLATLREQHPEQTGLPKKLSDPEYRERLADALAENRETAAIHQAGSKLKREAHRQRIGRHMKRRMRTGG